MPNEIDRAIQFLSISEDCSDHEKTIESFLSGIHILNDLIEDSHPESKKIKAIKTSYTRSLLSKLAQSRKDIEHQDIWNAYCLIFLVLCKNETSLIVNSNTELKKYLIEFVGLFSDKASTEIEKIINDYTNAHLK
jgi:hypothetical protein